VGALGLAGAVGAALFRRATTGEPSVVDSSLLAAGMWQLGPDIVNARLGDDTHARQPDRYAAANPLMLPYRTSDGRWVALMVLSPDRHWRPLCALLGQPGLADDPRFADSDGRRAHARACVESLEAAFAEQPLAEWRRRLQGFAGEWSVVQEPAELADDPQAQANGYLAEVEMGDGAGDVRVPMVTSPVQYDEEPGRPTRAPEPGEHTEQVLLEVGLTWPEIGTLKDRGAIT
jgi:crotonobetainyl-CoA:carnitine CoA-transferase CaiB-like acyl-CoA transferase